VIVTDKEKRLAILNLMKGTLISSHPMPDLTINGVVYPGGVAETRTEPDPGIVVLCEDWLARHPEDQD
jgi:hypothetical protein